MRAGFAVLLSCGVVGAAAWLVFFSPVLGVREITVSGNARLPAERVRGAAGVPDRQPLATVDLDLVRGRVAALREVESATVERSWPGTLRVRVTERRPLAVVVSGGRAAVVDRHAVVIETRSSAPPGLPELHVSRFGRGDPATRAALAVVGGLPWQLAGRVETVRATTADDVSLRLGDGRTIMWGGAEKTRAKARIALRLLEQRADTYDVSSTDVVTVQ
ncbi:FtsQ-type POTRA domain-containing protein [Sphaerisporangium sp. TRM90804]|uniref:cell division protein FtsQ/DivIB n=1 Tax=Sphaerisporangium sp. TRM90804 TaxID=3031113 RepID=UPI00244ADB5A|nr:FtsQ-type POTRA domain-containing protein [Sphaerisporangium sp. TRM90804]MDH2428609.1 FtsQ-type POTRA domain-containing protein [Sphaerisporangium sp. TRM90804]